MGYALFKRMVKSKLRELVSTPFN